MNTQRWISFSTDIFTIRKTLNYASVSFEDDEKTFGYNLFVNLGGEIVFDDSLDGKDVTYELCVNYGDSKETLDGTVTRSDGKYIVSIPTLEELKTRLGIESAEEINFFEIVVSEC